MRISRLLAGVAVAALVFTLLLTGASASPPPQASTSVPVCPGPAAPDSARCHSHVVTSVRRFATTGPTGLGPAAIVSAYGWGSIGSGSGKTIAIVDAYDDPNALSDLDSFSQQFGLPRPCSVVGGTAGSSCFNFTKVNQTGGGTYPRANSGWALEISLDVQWAHAVAPLAAVLLVEASSNSFANLLAAEDYAKANAQYVSNSWGGSEFSSETSYDPHFSQTGVSFFVSSGDNGTPAEYPSSSRNVVSVGGTTLDGSIVGGWSETGWVYSGGGCSLYETANSAQVTGSVNCNGMRATPDVSLDANPYTGVSVVDTFGYLGQSGWFVVGGTSASSPMWAARSAAAGVVVDANYVYGSSITFRDILAGSSSTQQSGCNSAGCLVGYDMTTGRGTWTGAGAAGPTPTPTPTATPTPTPTATPTPTPTPTTQTMTVSGISYATSGGRNQSKDLQVTVSVTSGGSPVSGASVSITLKNTTINTSWTGSGTTDPSGAVTFTLNNAPSGTYTTVVTSVTTSGYQWDNNYPPNSYTKQ